MEFGDASDKQAPPPPPKNIDLLEIVRMNIVAMIQGLESNSSLK